VAKKHSEEFVKLVNEALTRVDEVTIEDFLESLRQNKEFNLIDVREKDEWDKGRIPGAIHLSKGVIERDIEDEIPDKNEEVILYCGGGYRSALAADNLQKMGYKNVKSLAGGWRGWTNKNYPAENQ